MKTLSTFALRLVLLVLLAPAMAAPPALKTWRVAPSAGLVNSPAVQGRVEAARHAVLALPVQGAVVTLPVQVGDKVVAGQLLLRVDARGAAQGAQAAAALSDSARAQQQLAQQQLARQRQLKAQGFISQAALDEAQAQFEASSALARAQVAQAGAAGTQAGLHELRAPFDGVVAELPVTLGDLAQPGRPLAVVYDPTRLRVAVHLAPTQAPMPSVGLEGGALLTATRIQRLPLVDSASHTVQWRLDLPPGTAATPGQFARVAVQAPQGPAAGDATRLWVPRSSVMQRGELDLLYVLSADKRAVLRQVRLGAAQGTQVEVLAGLKAGEDLVLEPLAVRGAKP